MTARSTSVRRRTAISKYFERCAKVTESGQLLTKDEARRIAVNIAKLPEPAAPAASRRHG